MSDVHDDLAAYVVFEARFGASGADRPRLLEAAGLSGIGLARLRAEWDARFAGDPALEDRYEESLDADRSASLPSAPIEPAPAVDAASPHVVMVPFVGTPSGSRSPWELEDVDSTQRVRTLPSGPALPFAPADPSAPQFEQLARLVSPASPAPRLDHVDIRIEDELDRTGPITTLPDTSALPFRSAKDGSAEAGGQSLASTSVALTAAQYASLCVDLEQQPLHARAIRDRYGVGDDTAWVALKRNWAERFEREPGLHAEWVTLCADYRAWLAANR